MTKLDEWIQTAKNCNAMYRPHLDEAIAVIEKWKEALEQIKPHQAARFDGLEMYEWRQAAAQLSEEALAIDPEKL